MDQQLKQIFLNAAELSSAVPEHLQPMAFSKAVDFFILGEKPKSHRLKRTLVAVSTKEKTKNGPKGTLRALADESFMSDFHSLAEIHEHIKHKRGQYIEPKQLAAAAVRLIRDGILDRDQNEGGLYVYRRAQTQ